MASLALALGGGAVDGLAAGIPSQAVLDRSSGCNAADCRVPAELNLVDRSARMREYLHAESDGYAAVPWRRLTSSRSARGPRPRCCRQLRRVGRAAAPSACRRAAASDPFRVDQERAAPGAVARRRVAGSQQGDGFRCDRGRPPVRYRCRAATRSRRCCRRNGQDHPGAGRWGRDRGRFRQRADDVQPGPRRRQDGAVLAWGRPAPRRQNPEQGASCGT